MADQKINALPTKTAPVTGDKCLMSGAAEEYLIDYDKLATAILNKLTSKTFTLDQGTKTLIAAVNELNSKKLTIELFNGSTLDIDLPGFYVYIIQKTKISNLVDKSVSAALGAWCIVINVTSAGTGSQFITSIDNTSQVFKRTFAAKVWSAWNNNMPATSGEYNGDCNDIVQPGFFNKVITPSSGHSPGFYAYILVLKYTNTQGTETNFTQVAFPYNSANPIKTRYRFAGTWSEWA